MVPEQGKRHNIFSLPRPMQIALSEAKEAFMQGEVPVGCVIMDSTGAVLSQTHNGILMRKDPTAHAEILALREAGLRYGSERLIDCDLYVTLEPCAMCAAAISFARIRRLYFSAGDVKAGAVENGIRFFQTASCFHRPDVYEGYGEKESSRLLRDFFALRR